MLTSCLHWDLRRTAHSPTDLLRQLERLSHADALLVTGKTSFLSEWRQPRHLILMDGPSLFQLLYTPALERSGQPSPRVAQQSRWLDLFPKLRQLAETGQDFAAELGRLEQEMVELLDWEKARLFPCLDQFLGDTRATRDLSYEQLGLRRLLPRLREVLDSLPSWTPQRRKQEWEKLSLDLIHLLEHHLEHKERGAYPLYELICPSRKE